MQLVIDMETRSEIDLKSCGVYKYAQDSSTDILCIAIKINDLDSQIWIPEQFNSKKLEDLPLIGNSFLKLSIENADTIVAHNANFELVLWHEIMHKRLNFPDIPLRKWKCTAAKASAHALPRDLERACMALGLEQKKDTDGKRIMMKWCKPRRPTKNNLDAWHNDIKEYKKLCEYCIQDVAAEYQLDKALYDLSLKETQVWRHDQKINSRGVYVDLEAINNLINKVKLKEKNLLNEIKEITYNTVTSARQVAKTLEYLNSRGLNLPDLQKTTVSEKPSATRDAVVRRKGYCRFQPCIPTSHDELVALSGTSLSPDHR